jgi:REP element-mobilizing transposase RayT
MPDDHLHPSWRFRTWGRSRSVRLDTESYIADDTSYFVTVCCRDHIPYLESPHVAQCVLDTWCEVSQTLRYHLWAICLMPDHLHVLVTRKPKAPSLGRYIGAAKSLAANRAPEPGVRWQARFYDHIVRPDEDPDRIAWYIAENPVRKGLVEVWSEWPWTYLDEILIP